MKFFISVILLVVFVSCQKNENASEALRSYVKKISSSKMTQEDYREISTGKLLETIEGMSADEFEKYSANSIVKNQKTKILSENCEASNCTITYLVSYRSKTSDGSEYKTEVRKIAQLAKENDVWKLANVENIKTYHESADALDPLEE